MKSTTAASQHPALLRPCLSNKFERRCGHVCLAATRVCLILAAGFITRCPFVADCRRLGLAGRQPPSQVFSIVSVAHSSVFRCLPVAACPLPLASVCLQQRCLSALSLPCHTRQRLVASVVAALVFTFLSFKTRLGGRSHAPRCLFRAQCPHFLHPVPAIAHGLDRFHSTPLHAVPTTPLMTHNPLSLAHRSQVSPCRPIHPAPLQRRIHATTCAQFSRLPTARNVPCHVVTGGVSRSLVTSPPITPRTHETGNARSRSIIKHADRMAAASLERLGGGQHSLTHWRTHEAPPDSLVMGRLGGQKIAVVALPGGSRCGMVVMVVGGWRCLGPHVYGGAPLLRGSMPRWWLRLRPGRARRRQPA